MVGFAFRFEQFRAPDLAFRIKLADSGLLVIGKAGSHRACGNEDRGQVAESQRGNRQPRHDLVADAEIDSSIEHVVGQADGRSHGDDIAGKQREIHARLALGDAVAHGGDATGNLRHATGLGCSFLDQGRECLKRLMGRQHIIVGGDDAQIGNHIPGQSRLVTGIAGCKAVGEVAAGQRGAVGAGSRCRTHAV